MTIDAWLQAAVADAERRGLAELRPLLDTLARATRTLRGADFNRSPLVPRSRGGSPGERREGSPERPRRRP